MTTTARRAWLFQVRLPFWFWFSLCVQRRRTQQPATVELPLCMVMPWHHFCLHLEYHDNLWPCLDPGDLANEEMIWEEGTQVDWYETLPLSALATQRIKTT